MLGENKNKKACRSVPKIDDEKGTDGRRWPMASTAFGISYKDKQL
jgi:hypothetical protein